MKCSAFQVRTREYWARWTDGKPLNREELKRIRRLRRDLRTRPLEGESERAWFERVRSIIEPHRREN